MSSIKKNLGLQTLFQVLNTCLPLITAPYLARKLGVTQLGIFSYTTSVVAYFALFAMLGTVNYGTRCIASTKTDKKSRSKMFWGIFFLQTIVVGIAFFAYIVYLVFFCHDNKTIATIQTLTIIACFFDITWFFFGIEEFKITVTRSIVIKFITVALILLLVKTENDLWIYTIIMLGGTLLSQLVLFLYLPKYITWQKVSGQDIWSHVKPNLVLFVPLLAMSVYHTMDKTMLGRLSTYEQSGFYYNSDKVINVPLAVINGVGTVMLPRMSNLLKEKKQKEADELFITTLEGIAAISIALSCGIAAVSNEFIPFFYGQGYDPCILLTIVFSPILVVKSFSMIARTQYLIPMNMEKEFTKSVVGGAIVNLFFNLILIPPYGALGAVIATFLAELVACLLQFISLRGKNLRMKMLLFQIMVYLIIGFSMIVVVRMASFIHVNSLVIKLMFEICAGIVVYGIICMVYWRKTNNRFYQIIVDPFVHRLIK